MRTWIHVVCLLLVGVSGVAAQELAPVGVQPGGRLPPLRGVDLSGAPVDVAPLLGKSTVVLSFWSIHCGDCIRELDDLRAIRREFPPREVTVVAVNTDSGLPVERIAEFVRRYESAQGALDVRHLLDRDATVVDALGISFIPLLLVVDQSAVVSSVMTGYVEQDQPRLSQAVQEGRVALGAWSAGLRGRLRSVLRGSGPGGRPVEWGSFRVEDGMPLYGLYDAQGWLRDAAGRRDREAEISRVEAVVADRLRLALLQEALASIGVRLPPLEPASGGARGLVIPESPFAQDGRWRRLFDALQFEELVRVENRSSNWVGDEYSAGMVGDVDLGQLRTRLQGRGFPADPVSIRLITVSDFEYKPRALLRALLRNSYRVEGVRGDRVRYYGTVNQLAEELRAQAREVFRSYVEVGPEDQIRLEVY